jgi:hypothetical protein
MEAKNIELRDYLTISREAFSELLKNMGGFSQLLKKKIKEKLKQMLTSGKTKKCTRKGMQTRPPM